MKSENHNIGTKMIDSIIRYFGFDTKSDKELKAQNVALKALRQKLELEVREAEIKLRETEIMTLFAATGREYTAANAAPYFDFDARQFDFIKQVQSTSIN